ncbi:MAG: transporter [endosymbiont of Galathealinum brachiosum]|uniref:Transporter n=1 Tax=endosymbiont of Galathealinum brachiosum TaxID=2200906 RepID=A0A370DFI2_9GAMM|nr:MAG: transporter [endosymbiont of Galathealinum brachiosum]
MNAVTEKNNFLYLVISLVFLLLAGALVDQFPNNIGHHIIQAVTVITLAAGVAGFKTSKVWFHTGLGFAALVLVVVVLNVLLDIAGLSYLHLFFLTTFYSWVTWLAARQVLFTGPIDGNKIIGAICIYLLMGLIWTMFYLFIAQAIPGAFNGLQHVVWYDNFADVAYYSFVTLTTLGYGDISPVAPVARFLVYMEAIVGVFYMAILVASLIGVKISAVQADKE